MISIPAIAVSIPAIVTFVELAGEVRIEVPLLLTILSVDIIRLLLAVDFVCRLLVLMILGSSVMRVLQRRRLTRILIVAGRIVIDSGCIVAYAERRDDGRLRILENGASGFRFGLSRPPHTTLGCCGFVLERCQNRILLIVYALA